MANLGSFTDYLSRYWKFSGASGNGFLEDVFGRWFGNNLTSAEKEANAWTAAREDYMLDRQTDLANTSYQRQVADMQKAGLNPMLALGAGGAAAPSVNTAGSVSPSGAGVSISDLISLFTVSSQLKNLKAARELDDAKASEARSAADKNDAEAAEARSREQKNLEDTRTAKLNNDYFEEVRGLRRESEELANNLSRAQYKQIWKSLDVMNSEITKNIEQAHSEQERQKLMIAQAILATEEADNIVKMRPYIQRAMDASTELDTKLGKVAAVDEAYRQGLLNNKVIEKSIAETDSKIKVNEAIAELNRIHGLIEKGDKHALSSELGTLDKLDFWLNQTFDALKDVSDAVPVTFVVK